MRPLALEMGSGRARGACPPLFSVTTRDRSRLHLSPSPIQTQDHPRRRDGWGFGFPEGRLASRCVGWASGF